LWSPTSYTYLNNRGIYPVNLFNPDFAWELNNKLEAAIELGFLKDRIYLSSAYYRNRSGSQLVGYPLPSITGFSTITANLPAVVQNAGLEMELRTINIRSTRLVWSTSFNFTIPKNKLVKYPNFESSPYYQTYQVGMPLNVVPVFTFNGINAQTGVYEFKTSQGSVTSTPDFNTDRQKWVDLTPKFYGGLQNSISFKNFQFDLSIQFFKQKGIDNISIFDAPGRLGNQPREVLNRWQHPGDKSAVQQYTQDFTTAYLSYLYLGYSDKAYIDASFIRVKNLSISYRLPVNLKQKSHAQGMRIYVQGQNLFTITHYSGMDPESGQISLPPLRVLTAGIQFTF
jgi:TonB-dependent starch-binding outer membrane protein SusC